MDKKIQFYPRQMGKVHQMRIDIMWGRALGNNVAFIGPFPCWEWPDWKWPKREHG